MADKRQAPSDEALRRQSGPGQAGKGRPGTCRLLATAAFALSLALAGPAHAETLSGQARIIDGDTFVIAGERIRLDGIDAPETRQTCTRNGRRWACGKAATRAVRQLVGRNQVRCEISGRDKYGRAIAACFAAGRDLQQELVRQGLALACRKYSARYVPDEDAARDEGCGLWSGEFVEPWRWRKERRGAGSRAGQRPHPARNPDSSCLIKGNISDRGRIYHVPGGYHHERTRIDEAPWRALVLQQGRGPRGRMRARKAMTAPRWLSTGSRRSSRCGDGRSPSKRPVFRNPKDRA